MSKRVLITLFASTAMSALLPHTALAQVAAAVPASASPTTPPTATADTTAPSAIAGTTAPASEAPAIGEILVTARRRGENLQNVPVSEQVVTGSTLQRLSITAASDISKLAPGLNISPDPGVNQAVTLRGVTWEPGSGTPATPFYLNEIPFDPASSIRALFDIGQIEVLRGPQGTTRGAPSISGAVTITTKKPDLEHVGGYIQGTYGQGDHGDIQGAFNYPIIKDILAVRLSANIEQNDANRIYSVNSNEKPHFNSSTLRATVLFKPTDTLTVEAMYQHRQGSTREYLQVAGPGSPGAAGGIDPATGLVSPNIPAHFNGPALTTAQRASVQDATNFIPDKMDLITVNASWHVLGQVLNYNYGRQISHTPANKESLDPANILPGYEPYSSTYFTGTPLFQTQEVRLSSDHAPGRFFDYDLGFFQKKSGAIDNFDQPAILAGAFGNSGAYGGFNPNPNEAYVVQSHTQIFLGQQYDSFYGNVQLHLPYNIELSGGLRQIRDRVPVTLAVTTQAALNNVSSVFLPPAYCAFAGGGVFSSGPSATYPGTCDISLPAGYGAPAPEDFDPVYHATIYNISLSKKISSTVLAYFTTGTSYRSGLPAIDNPGLPGSLALPKPETATSYEVGLKTSWWHRLFINADVFQINYKNQLTTFQGVQYYNSVTESAALTSLAFYSNVNARVRGVEFELDGSVTDNLSFGLHGSYTPIKSRGGLVPCNVGAAISVANPINECVSPVGQTLNQSAPFQATASGSYSHPLTETVDGYLRFNVNFQGKNPNFGNDPAADGTFLEGHQYAVVDVFAGLTGHKGVWDVSLYAKNVFNNTTELTRTALIDSIYSPYAAAPTGYSQVTSVLPREVGLTLRFAFGAR